MLQQTQVATVVPYFQRWLERFPDAATLAHATEQEVLQAWEGLGYYARARNLHKAAQKITSESGGAFPSELQRISELPGAGRYTAAAVATFAFDQPTPPVDGNIARVIARLTNFWEPIDEAAGLERIWKTAETWQPESHPGLFNEAMMELGALICTPRAPACLICPVRTFCHAQQPELLPVKKPRQKTVRLAEECGWIVRNGEVLLEQQTGSRWRGLWRLPLLTLSVYQGSSPLIMPENQRWFPLEEIAAVPMTAAHRRALKRLLKLKV